MGGLGMSLIQFNLNNADMAAKVKNGARFANSPSFRVPFLRPEPNPKKSDGTETMWAKIQRQRKEGHPKFKGGRWVEVPLELDSPFAVIRGYGNQTTKAKELKKYEENVDKST
jgi:hypothetical protein